MSTGTKIANTLAKADPRVTGIVLFVIVAVILYYSGRRSGKSGTVKPIKAFQLPNSGKGIPEGWNPSDLAKRLYDNMSGINWTLKDNSTLFREFAQLPTDDMFVAVAIRYNDAYKKSDRFGLRKDIEDETYVNWGSVPFEESWKKKVLDRLEKFNF